MKDVNFKVETVEEFMARGGEIKKVKVDELYGKYRSYNGTFKEYRKFLDKKKGQEDANSK